MGGWRVLLLLAGLWLALGLAGLWYPRAQHPDDGFLFALQLPLAQKGFAAGTQENLARDYAESGRLRPVYIVALSAALWWFGPDAFAYHILMSLLWAVSGLWGYYVLRKWALPQALALPLALALVLGPAAEAWQYHLYSEPWAYIGLLWALWGIAPGQPRWARWAALGGLVLAGLSKEPFWLIILAWAWLCYRTHPRSRPWPALVALLLCGLALGYIRLYMSTTLNDEFGFSWHLLQPLGLLEVVVQWLLTGWGGWLVLLLGLVTILARQHRLSARDLLPWLLLVLLWVGPQLLVHSLTGLRAGRYHFPAVWGFLWLLIPLYRSLPPVASAKPALQRGVIVLAWACLGLNAGSWVVAQHSWVETVRPYRGYCRAIAALPKGTTLWLVGDTAAANYELTHLVAWARHHGLVPKVVLVDLYFRSPQALQRLRTLAHYPLTDSLRPTTGHWLAIVPHLAAELEEGGGLRAWVALQGVLLYNSNAFLVGGHLPVLGTYWAQAQVFSLHRIDR